MTQVQPEHRRVQGHVKWFDPAKGFGFIVAQDGGPDILLHANALRNFGQGSVCDEAGIEVVVQETPRGLQTVEVLWITPPPMVLANGDNESGAPDDAPESDLPFLPARVKWFDKVKGFGFANTFGSAEDIFIHMEVLRRSGFADLQPGEAIGLRVTDGDRGKMALSIGPWEAALKQVTEAAVPGL
ncbi:cold-shock protein [Roseicitreum antarcticum]|uniref:Cold-shock DNA-binding protein family n=1 Tax=Roseicitreum antarcticum TaxID=564137 RepID=A0A1H3A559_9RHOB|nr:cold shock domain-containing protein [Roseicitreum antarcticum]SDX24561.1 cold-shock DNA-binding protein family [Roseicitreum antarcticum]